VRSTAAVAAANVRAAHDAALDRMAASVAAPR
jgi:hypothetical protein